MTIEEMNRRKRELGYSDERIAALSGVPLSTVRKVLGGITKAPREKTISALENVLKEKLATYNYSYPPAAEVCMVQEPSAAYGRRKIKNQGEFTLEDYLSLPDDLRAELIDGVLYDMGSPLGSHQLITGEIYAAFRNYIRKKGGSCLPLVSPLDVQLDCDNRTILEPDVIVLCDRSKYTPQRIAGAPDLVVEVLSRSTRQKDLFVKLPKYKKAGVREFWIVDPDKETVMVYWFEQDDTIGFYHFTDTVPVGIFGGECSVDFSEIQALLRELPG